jgi:hypothetical protein
MQQTQAMLEQKRLALKFGLPQYLGFSKQMEAQANSPLAALHLTPRIGTHL